MPQIGFYCRWQESERNLRQKWGNDNLSKGNTGLIHQKMMTGAVLCYFGPVSASGESYHQLNIIR